MKNNHKNLYQELETLISTADDDNKSTDVDISMLRDVQQQINDLQRNYFQLATAMGADIDKATHKECLQVAQVLNKVKTMLVHARPEETAAYFICGENGKKDKFNLPEHIMVCPQYGLDGFAMYKKYKDYSAPGY